VNKNPFDAEPPHGNEPHSGDGDSGITEPLGEMISEGRLKLGRGRGAGNALPAAAPL
jgi:hypothetical protein